MSKLEDELGDIVAKARVGLGLTTDQLAAKVGLSRAQIEDIEGYVFIPNDLTIAGFAEVLHLDAAKLNTIGNGWVPELRDLPQVESFGVPFGPYLENCYGISDSSAGLAVVVDPGGAVKEIAQWLSNNKLTLGAILLTHSHADHIAGVRNLLEQWPTAQLLLHHSHKMATEPDLAGVCCLVEDATEFRLGELTIKPIYTTGHTVDSVSYCVNSLCFTGDTIFAGSIGRPASSKVYKDMLENIRVKLLSLPDETLILPGHGPATTVGEEKAHNPFF